MKKVSKEVLGILTLIEISFIVNSAAGVVGNGFLLKSDTVCKIWWTGNTYKIMRDDPVPVKKRKIVLYAAQNESEAFQIVLCPQVNMENLTVKITDFRNNKRNLISAGNVTIRKVEYVHVTKPSGKLHRAGWYPDPLPLYEGPFCAKVGINTPLWFTIKVPKDAPSGNYSASLNIETAFWKVTIPVELHVWDFSLPERPYMRSAFGLYSDLIRQYHNLDNDDELKQVLDLYYQSFREYRISPQKFYDLYPIKKTVKGLWWYGGTFDPDTVFSGKYSYQVTDNSVNSNVGATCSDLIRINPEKPYWVKWWAKTLREKQQYAITVKSYDSDKKPIPWHLQGMVYSGSICWCRDSLFLDPVNPLVIDDIVLSRPLPKKANYISIQLYPVVPDDKGEEKGTAWFDNLEFIDAETNVNLLPHGNFEQDMNDLDIELDFSDFDIAARRYLDEFGFTGFRIQIPELRPGPFVGRKTGWFSGFINGTEEYRKLIRLYLIHLQDHLEANGWLGKEYLYWIDEPKHEDYDFVREGMKTIHDAAPKLTRFITENNPGPEIMDVTEIGCPVLAKYDPVKSQEWIIKGRKMWSYLMTWPKAPHLNLFIDGDAINMRMWLWMSYRYHLTGILVWNSNAWNAKGCSPPGLLQNIWEDPMTYMDGHGSPIGAAAEYGNGDGMFFYPPNRDPNNDKTKYLSGPVPSLRLEILREGIEDYDYMILLENFMKNAHSDQLILVEKARQILNFNQDVFVNEHEYTKNVEVLMNYRQQMGILLEQFNHYSKQFYH